MWGFCGVFFFFMILVWSNDYEIVYILDYFVGSWCFVGCWLGYGIISYVFIFIVVGYWLSGYCGVYVFGCFGV